MRRAPLLVALFLAAIALRPQLVGIGPLLPLVQDDLDVTHAVAGLLGTIPVLCMGLFAPPASFLSGRIGSRRAVAVALALIGVFGVARAIAPGAIAVILLTFPVGVGMGLAGAMLPVAVKERFADRPGFATGVYTSGITIGSAIAAAVAVPLAHAAGGWRTPLLVFGAVSTGLAMLWLWLTRTEPTHVRVDIRPLRLPVRRLLAWRLVAAFFFMSSVFYGLNAWLPDSYVERGWSQSSAGGLLAVLNTVTIPVGFAVAWAADHWGSRRGWLTGAATLQLVALLGIVLWPDGRLGLGGAARHGDRPALPADDDAAARRGRAPGGGRGARRDDARRRLHALGEFSAAARRAARPDRRLRRGALGARRRGRDPDRRRCLVQPCETERFVFGGRK